MNSAKCPLAHCGGFLEFISVSGKVVDCCPQCDRRRAGVCRDCPFSVDGQRGKAVRCKRCRKARRRQDEHERRRQPEYQARKSDYYRRLKKRPEYRERRRVTRRAWRARNPEKVRQYRRRYFLKQTPGYVAGYTRANRDPVRAAKKRAQSLAKYYELHPVRPDPRCSGCRVKIEWDGRGRPRQTCDACCAPAELRRRQSGHNQAEYRRQHRRAA